MLKRNIPLEREQKAEFNDVLYVNVENFAVGPAKTGGEVLTVRNGRSRGNDLGGSGSARWYALAICRCLLLMLLLILLKEF